MKQYSLLVLLILGVGVSAQVPVATAVTILKAEDARRYDKTLEELLTSPNAAIRERAALAAGRIGDAAAVAALVRMLDADADPAVREMAAFALGEIESIDAADAVLRAIGETGRAQVPGAKEPENGNRARLVEAAGKIAAANAQHAKAKDLAAAVVFTLEAELNRAGGHHKPTVMLALTAALRARPAGADVSVRKFLAFTDPDIVSTALNTLARLRAKNSSRGARDLLATHVNAVVRANAARLLGAAEDKESADALIKAATGDSDPRVRISAIRSLGTLGEKRAGDALIRHGNTLLAAYEKSKARWPPEKNELLELTAAIGRLLAGTDNKDAIDLLRRFGKHDAFHSTEPAFALLRVRPVAKRTADEKPPDFGWRQASTVAQIFGEVTAANAKTDAEKELASDGLTAMRETINAFLADSANSAPDPAKLILAGSDHLRSFAKHKPADLTEVLRKSLGHRDVIFRSTAADLLADQPSSKENVEALKAAFTNALFIDKVYNDAQLSILDALFKLDKRGSIETFRSALDAPDYLVRKKAFALLADQDLEKDFPAIASAVENARKAGKDRVLAYDPATGTKLGQILNGDGDYRRALSRKNGSIRAVLTTEKGVFTIEFYPEEAPLTVDNFVRLARSGYFNDLEVHRVVPNFVMQDGDPRGDGNGGPGWSIRCEVNMVPYERGAVGIALSGKDTGGSQWFVTHSPQPHLDGGYTVFGRVNERDMKVVDKIVRGDKIISVRIVGR